MMCLASVSFWASDIKTGFKVFHVTFFDQGLSWQYVFEVDKLCLSFHASFPICVLNLEKIKMLIATGLIVS